ncbi:MAG: GNAT family N-acetyltransferase [Paracoccaceae bacterium]
MTPTFRPLAPADLDTVAALWLEGWRLGHHAVVPAELTRLRTEDSFRDRLARNIDKTFVATDDGEILGFTLLKGNEIDQFYVSAAARGAGVAQAQMAEAERRLRAAGHETAWLACTVGNTRAARFYEKAGFTRAATQRMSFETSAGPFPIDIWRYEKTL